MKYKQSERIFSFSFLVVLLLVLLSFSERKKPLLNAAENFVIKNKATGMVLVTPIDGNEHTLTHRSDINNKQSIWQIVSTEMPNQYQISNIASGEPIKLPDHFTNNIASSSLSDQFVEKNNLLLWEFEIIGDKYYRISLPESSHVLTSNDESEGIVVLDEWSNTDNQYWELLESEPIN